MRPARRCVVEQCCRALEATQAPGARADKGPHAGAADQQPLGDQPIVGHADGVAGRGQPLGQLAAGRQRLAGQQPPVQDRRAELPAHLPAQITPAVQANMHIHGRSGHGVHRDSTRWTEPGQNLDATWMASRQHRTKLHAAWVASE
jgi:hypothetical protein